MNAPSLSERHKTSSAVLRSHAPAYQDFLKTSAFLSGSVDPFSADPLFLSVGLRDVNCGRGIFGRFESSVKAFGGGFWSICITGSVRLSNSRGFKSGLGFKGGFGDLSLGKGFGRRGEGPAAGLSLELGLQTSYSSSSVGSWTAIGDLLAFTLGLGFGGNECDCVLGIGIGHSLLAGRDNEFPSFSGTS